MPASSTDLIDAALFSAFSRRTGEDFEESPYASIDETQYFPSLKQASLVEFDLNGYHTKKQLNFGSTSFDTLKSKYGTLMPNLLSDKVSKSHKTPKMAHSRNSSEDKLEEPKTVLWSHDKVTLGWRKNFPPGAGMINLGNTCYMNSSLQALFHIPSLVNWLLDEANSHISSCESNSHNASFCSICGMMRTLRQSLDRGNSHIKPAQIHNKLKCIGKTLIYGRQEDAHEFIKLLLDHMEKSFLTFMKANRLDHRSKETTPLNQIFGGYLRQQVICPLCHYVSTTFSHFQDIVLDIRSAGSVEDALNLYFRKETLDSDNAYKCENCHKKVPATKRHLIEKAPHVLLLQLKRFTMSGGKITRHINIDKTIDLSRYVNGVKSCHGNSAGPYFYKFVSMVIHIGGSQHGGHYTAVAEASNKTMFEFDDSSVRAISMQTALLKNPYILFYEMVQKPKSAAPVVKPVMRQSSEKVLLKHNSSDQVLKPLPTSFSTNCMSKTSDDIGEAVARKNHSHYKNSPLINIKERDRVSFGVQISSNKGQTDKYIRNGNASSCNSGYSSKPPVASSSAIVNSSSKNGSYSSSLVPYKTDSDDSDNENSGKKLVNGHASKVNGHCKSFDGDREFGNSGNLIVKVTKSPYNGTSQTSNKPPAFLPRMLQVNSSNKSYGTNNTKCNGHSKLTNGFAIDKSNLTKPKLENGYVNGNSPAKEQSMATGKIMKTMTDSSSKSSIDVRPVLQFDGKDVSVKDEYNSWPSATKQKPELEKSLSQDSVLPAKSTKLFDKIETASLKSKDSIDSIKSVKFTKKSLFSLFTCVTATQSPEMSPDHEHLHFIKESKTGSPINEDPKSIQGNLSEAVFASNHDCGLSKRNRDREEYEPSSPSKKCKPVDRLQSNGSECMINLKCFKSNSGKDLDDDCGSPKCSRIPSSSSPSSLGNKTIANAGHGSPKDEENFSMEDKKSKHKRKESKHNKDGEDRHSEQRNILNAHVVEIAWNKNLKDLSFKSSESKNSDHSSSDFARKKYASEMLDKCKSSSVVDELKRSGEYSFGAKVETWEGGLSSVDSETQRCRNEARKRTADEIYNEEFDTGKVPKKRHKNFESDEHFPKENPFQKYQEFNYNEQRESGQSKSWEDSSRQSFKQNSFKFNYKNKKNNHSRVWNSNFRNFDNRNHYRSNSYGSKSWKQKPRNGYNNRNRDNYRF